MITHPDSPSAEAFTVAAKNIAAQCSIQHFKRQDETKAETKWDSLSPEERNEQFVEIFSIDDPEWQNKIWAELEQVTQDAIIQHLFGESKAQTTPITS